MPGDKGGERYAILKASILLVSVEELCKIFLSKLNILK